MNKEEIIKWLREYVSATYLVPDKEIRNDVSIFTYGIDSINMVGLLGDLSEVLGIDLDLEEFDSFPTIESIAKQVCVLANESSELK